MVDVDAQHVRMEHGFRAVHEEGARREGRVHGGARGGGGGGLVGREAREEVGRGRAQAEGRVGAGQAARSVHTAHTARRARQEGTRPQVESEHIGSDVVSLENYNNVIANSLVEEILGLPQGCVL